MLRQWLDHVFGGLAQFRIPAPPCNTYRIWVGRPYRMRFSSIDERCPPMAWDFGDDLAWTHEEELNWNLRKAALYSDTYNGYPTELIIPYPWYEKCQGFLEKHRDTWATVGNSPRFKVTAIERQTPFYPWEDTVRVDIVAELRPAAVVQ